MDHLTPLRVIPRHVRTINKIMENNLVTLENSPPKELLTTELLQLSTSQSLQTMEP